MLDSYTYRKTLLLAVLSPALLHEAVAQAGREDTVSSVSGESCSQAQVSELLPERSDVFQLQSEHKFFDRSHGILKGEVVLLASG